MGGASKSRPETPKGFLKGGDLVPSGIVSLRTQRTLEGNVSGPGVFADVIGETDWSGARSHDGSVLIREHGAAEAEEAMWTLGRGWRDAATPQGALQVAEARRAQGPRAWGGDWGCRHLALCLWLQDCEPAAWGTGTPGDGISEDAPWQQFGGALGKRGGRLSP